MSKREVKKIIIKKYETTEKDSLYILKGKLNHMFKTSEGLKESLEKELSEPIYTTIDLRVLREDKKEELIKKAYEIIDYHNVSLPDSAIPFANNPTKDYYKILRITNKNF